MARRAPEHTILVSAGEVRLEDAAMLERMARRAEREYRKTRKVGHTLAATWLRSAATQLKTAAGMDKRYLRPHAAEPTVVTKRTARKPGASRP